MPPAASPPPRPVTPGLLPGAFILLGLIWGSSFLWIKIALDGGTPAPTLVAWRMTLGTIGMLSFLPFIGQRLPGRLRELAPLVVLGFINAGLPIFLISWGEQFIDSGTASVLNSLMPLFSLLIAGLWLRTEPVSSMRVAGLVLGFAGAFLLASRELAVQASSMALVGALAVIAAAVSYALGASYARHRIRSAHRYVVAAGTLLFAAIDMWLLALLTGDASLPPLRFDVLFSIGWLGVLGSFVAYLLYFFLIEHLGATVAGMVTYLFPVVGVALGVTVLGEQLDPRLLLGTGLVLAGIVVVGLRYDRGVSRSAAEAPE
jgi:drug/metabolite transporter (DMT)-like permease